MTSQIAEVQFTTPATAIDLDITSPDITEDVKAVVLIWGNSTNDDTDESPARMGIAVISIEGLAATVDDIGGASCTMLRSGVATPDPEMLEGDDAAVLLPTNAASGSDIVSVVDSAIPGGVRLSFTTVTGGVQVKGKALIFAGSDTRSWGASIASTSTTPVQVDTGGVGTEFAPDVVICIPAANNSDTPARVSNRAYFGLGGIVGSTQKCGYINWANVVEPSDSDGVMRSDRAMASLTVGRAELGLVLALNSTGFTYAGADANDTRMRCLALKFSAGFNVGIANEAISGSTGVQNFTALGFQPHAILGASFLLASEDSLTDGSTAASAGVFISGVDDERAITIRAQEGLTAATHNPTGRQSDVALLTYDHLGSVAQQAASYGLVSGGFSLNFSVATAGFMTVLGFAPVQPPVALTDSETITDGSVVFASRALVTSDTVTISDGAVLAEFVMVESAGPTGWTFSAGADRGTLLVAGPEAGAIL